VARQYASLKQVAERAGVSFQTAAKVLNGGDVRVSSDTAQRIREAADELEYSPNALARGLVQKTTSTLGLVLGDMTDMALARFAMGVDLAARRHGQALLVTNLSGGVDSRPIVQMLMEHRVDGIIAAAPDLEDDQDLAELLRRRVPSVSLQHVPGRGVPVVGSNHRLIGRTVTEHLIGLGHTRIATVTGPFRRRVVRSRLRGWEDGLRDAGLEPGEDLIAEADWSAEGGAAAMRLLRQRDATFSAVFVQSDSMALGVLGAAADLGLAVPDDVAIVSCDDMPWAAFVNPPLTSVRLPYLETGEQAVELLLARIAGEDVPAEPVLLPFELVVRASCGSGRLAPKRSSAPNPKTQESS
jgi:LacI family transcriptional regulator